MILFLFILGYLFIRITVRTLYSVWLLQIKEYRVDRLREHFNLIINRRVYLNGLLFVKIILFLIIYYNLGSDKIGLSLLGGFYFVDIIFLSIGVLRRGLFRPVFTLKSFLIIVVTLLFYLGSAWFIILVSTTIVSVERIILYIISVDLIFDLVPFLMALLLKPVTWLIKKYIIYHATAKMRRYPNTKVVGITGSYGKSSVKEFLYTILSEKYKVLKTPKNINTDIGVAKFILRSMSNDYDLFVVEMGAYKKGEIKAICDIVSPKIGVLTGINSQHVGLFGSIENTIDAKFELLDSLSEEGVAVINNDCALIRENIRRIDKPELFRVSCYTDRGDYLVKNIKMTDKFTLFSVQLKNDSWQEITIPLVGEHSACNVLLAMSVASVLKMKSSDIVSSLKNIRQVEGTMSIFDGINGELIVDDSYNANPDGVFSALNYMKNCSRTRKVAFLSRIIELGEKSDAIHIKILKQARDVLTDIICSEIDYSAYFSRIIDSVDFDDVQVHLTKVGELPDALSDIGSDTVLLCEGRSSHRFCNKRKKTK